MSSIKDKEINMIADDLGVEPLFAKILCDKGIDSLEKYRDFINFDYKKIENPFSYSNVKEIVERINQAINKREVVVIYGDYDVDGICATSILYSYFREKGVEVYYYLPDRNDEGYGLNIDALEYIAQEYFPDLLITVDCGITAVDEVNYVLEALGFDVIITDHHEPSDKLPECLIFNPKLDRDKLFSDYSAGAIAQRLVDALEGEEWAKKYLDLAAIANVADVVPLVGDNRAITALGIQKINQDKKDWIRLVANKNDNISSSDIAFNIAPKLNSLGRLASAKEGVELIVEQSFSRMAEIIRKMNELNLERKAMTQDLYDACLEIIKRENLINKKIIILENKYWVSGILGLVAGMLTEKLKRPVILFTEKNGVFSGSGRSIEGVDIYNVLSQNKKYIIQFGGHSMACGLSVDFSQLNKFKESLYNFMDKTYKDDVFLQFKDKFSYSLNDILLTDKLFREIKSLEPTGEGNENALFSIKDANFKFQFIGNNNKHIKHQSSLGYDLVGFSLGEKRNIFNNNVPKTFKFYLDENSYNGKISAQGIIRDYNFNIKDSLDNLSHEDFMTRYLYTAIKKDKKANIQNLKFDEIDKIVGDNIWGTCIIAYLDTTYYEFLEYLSTNDKLNKKIIKHNYAAADDVFNCLVLDPFEEAMDLSLFSRVIFLDRPLSTYYYSGYKISQNASIFTVSRYNDIIKNNLKKALLEGSELLEIYQTIEKILNKTRVYSITELYEEYQKQEVRKEKLSFFIAVYIFNDLGLIKSNSRFGLKVESNSLSNINKSEFYSKIKEYIGLSS